MQVCYIEFILVNSSISKAFEKLHVVSFAKIAKPIVNSLPELKWITDFCQENQILRTLHDLDFYSCNFAVYKKKICSDVLNDLTKGLGTI